MNLPNLELVVFDMAGTTVFDGDAVNLCLRDALSAAGVEVSRDAVNAVMGIAKPLAILRLIEQSGHRELAHDEIVHDIYLDFEHRMLLHYRESPEVVEVGGASATFHWLRSLGVRVGLDTGFNRHIADMVIERMGWKHRDLIDVTVTSDEVERGRPFPDMIRHLMAVTGVTEAGAVAKVGDTPSDLEEGTNAGCGLVIGVTNGSHTQEELTPYPHTHLVPSVASLPELFRSLGVVELL